LHAFTQTLNPFPVTGGFMLWVDRHMAFRQEAIAEEKLRKRNGLSVFSHRFLPDLSRNTPGKGRNAPHFLTLRSQFLGNPIERFIDQALGVATATPFKEPDHLPAKLLIFRAGLVPIGIQSQQKTFKSCGRQIAFGRGWTIRIHTNRSFQSPQLS